MTTITIYKTDTDDYKGFTSKGHAGYANSGNDIVCAAISVLVINTINSIEEFVKDEAFDVEFNEKAGSISFFLKAKPLADTSLLLNSLVLGLKEIETQYGNSYVKLKFRRCKPC